MGFWLFKSIMVKTFSCKLIAIELSGATASPNGSWVILKVVPTGLIYLPLGNIDV